jgi:hypothetical protein
MPDEINTGAHGGGSDHAPRELHPAETVLALCVDVVALGPRPETYQGEDKGLTPKCALVFRSTEKRTDGTHHDLSKEYTVSTGRKAALRRDLESWRGQPYAEDYPDVPLHKMAGQWALITVVHRKSADGTKTYANIGAITSVPKVMRASLPTLPDYDRAPYWGERKSKYAAEAEAYRAAHPEKFGAPGGPQKPVAPPSPAPDFEAFPEALEDDADDLPF